MTSKEIILRQLQSTSNEIALKFDEKYKSDLGVVTQELATSYNILLGIVHKDKDYIPDNDFQSALLYWTALNSVLASLELLRRGYTKEPQMIMRNVLEIFAVAYNFHTDPNLYQQFIANPDKKFDSAKSITEAKKVHNIIGQQYGMLSQFFTHVGPLHVLPHKVTSGLCVGGMFDPNDQAIVNINLMAITGTLDILNSLLELTFVQHITNSRFWKKIDSTTYEYIPNRKRTEQILESMKQSIDSLGEEENTKY